MPRAVSKRDLLVIALLLAGGCGSESPSTVPTRDGGDDARMDGSTIEDASAEDAATGSGPCGRHETQLNDNAVWEVLSAEDDPIEGRPLEFNCFPRAIKVTPMGQPACEGDPYDIAYELESDFCSWITSRQPLLADVRQGDTIRVRAFHFRLTASVSRPAESRIALQIGEDVVWDVRRPIPSDSTLLNETFVAERDYPAGTPLYYHVDNHGNNDYLLFEIARVDL